MYDLKITGGTIVDGTGAARFVGDVAVKDGVIVAVSHGVARRRRRRDDRRHRAARHARLRRHPHALRRPGHVGPAARAVVGPRRHHRRRGQLRRRLRAGAPRRRGVAHRADGGRRGHPRHRAAARASTGAGRRSPSTSTRSTRRTFGIDVGAQVPHGAVRAYVMGERGAAQRAGHARRHRGHGARSCSEAVEAGALGFSTSRTLGHRAMDGEPVPGTFAAEDELFALGRAMAARRSRGVRARADGRGGRGPRRARRARSTGWCRLVRRDRPAGVVRAAAGRRRARPVARADGRVARAPPTPARRCARRSRRRPFGMLLGFPTPSRVQPAGPPTARWRDALLARRARSPSWRSPTVRAADPRRGRRPARPDRAVRRLVQLVQALARPALRRSATRPTTSPPPSRTHRRDGRGRRRRPARRCSTTSCSSTTRSTCSCCRSSTTPTATTTPSARCCCTRRGVSGLSDGGAHCGLICDASIPTFMLTHWARDRMPRRHAAARVPGEEADRRHRRALRARRPRRARRRARRPTSTSSTSTA